MADINDALESLGAGLIGSIPKVGALAASIFTIFWPDSEVNYWDQVKNQVYAAIRSALNQVKVQQLEDLLEGTKSNFQEYVDTTNPEEKKTRCIAFDVVLTQLKHPFMDESFDTVVYFVQYACYHISINVDILLFYNDEKNKQNLRALVDEYSEYAEMMSPRLTQYRLGRIDSSCNFNIRDPLLIRHNKRVTSGSGFNMTVTITWYGVAQDHHNGRVLVFSPFMTSVARPYVPLSNTEIPGGKQQCQRQLAEYRQSVESKTEAHWKKNLIDPIAIYRLSKILE